MQFAIKHRPLIEIENVARLHLEMQLKFVGEANEIESLT
jgi:hypothetical protein